MDTYVEQVEPSRLRRVLSPSLRRRERELREREYLKALVEELRGELKDRDEALLAAVRILQEPIAKTVTPEEELGRLMMRIIEAGHWRSVHLHRKLEDNVTDQTARGAALAASTLLRVHGGKLPPWAAAAFTRLAEAKPRSSQPPA